VTARRKTSAPLLAVEGLSKSFPGTRALDDLTFDVRPAEVHAVIGENGAGKTTLLNLLSGVYAPDAGRVRLRGQEASFSSPKDAQDAGIGTVFQELSLVHGLTVAENVFANRAPTRGPGIIDRHRLARQTRALLAQLGSSLRPDARVGKLSVAERQVVEIAKALSIDARVFLLDEPTSALSLEEAATLFDLLRRLKEQKIGIVFVSHRLAEVLEIADRITILRDGRLVATHDRGEVDTDLLVRSMVGRVLSQLYPDRSGDVGPSVLELRGVTGGDVGPVDLAVRAGEIVGLAGLRGSGRSTLTRLLFGAERIKSGEVLVQGNPAQLRSPWRARRAGVAFVPADRKEEGLFLRMSLADNLTAVALPEVSQAGIVNGAAQRRLAQRIREQLGIRAAGVDQTLARLSGGNQQKAMLGKWLAIAPRIFVVDEPTQGIDVGAKAEIHRLLRDLAAGGVAVVMSSSDLPELLGMCDRIAVLAGGRMRGVVEGAAATEEEVMSLAAETGWAA
jgi:ABC-type sugar transport system ATPase subunit